MKNVTIMMTVALAGAFAAPAQAAVPAGGSKPASALLVSDWPLAAPERPAPPVVSTADNRPASNNSGYFYAPGAGPGCESRIKRVQGRIYRACE